MEKIKRSPRRAAVATEPVHPLADAEQMSAPARPLSQNARALRFSRLTGWSLVLGPMTLAAAGLVHPQVTGDDAGSIAAAIGSQGAAWQAWAAMLLLGCLVAIPGVLRLMRRVEGGRGLTLTTVGAALVVGAAAGAGGFSILNSIMVTMVPLGTAPSPAVIQAITRSESDPLAGAVVLLFFVGVHLGWPLLLGGATRAGWASHWQWLLASAGSAAVFALSSVTLLIEALGLFAIAVAAAPTARRMVRGSTSDQPS